jgi:hypothetical protein
MKKTFLLGLGGESFKSNKKKSQLVSFVFSRSVGVEEGKGGKTHYFS